VVVERKYYTRHCDAENQTTVARLTSVPFCGPTQCDVSIMKEPLHDPTPVSYPNLIYVTQCGSGGLLDP
jgi:hypothetical protein